MALVTKYYLMEQVQIMLAGGAPSAGKKYEPGVVWAFLQQVINKKLKFEYLSVTLPGGETIPEGLVLANYDNVTVERYKGVSRAQLPAMPVSLRRGMGIWFVGPATPTLILDTPVISATVIGPTEIDLSWAAITNATSYLVERSTAADFSVAVTPIYSGAGLSFNNTGLTTATTYYYRITAMATLYTNSSYGYISATTT